MFQLASTSQVISSEVVLWMLAVGGLFAFGKNIVEVALRLQAYGKTKDGQATLLVVCVALCLATFLVIVLRG